MIKKNIARYGKGVTEGDTFERFTVETILKRYGLTYEQVEDGIVDGQNDGGIDSCYMFVNRALVATDTEMDAFKNPVEIDLYVMQSKVDTGFKEVAVTKLVTALPQLMALKAGKDELSVIYNDDVCSFFETYRKNVVALAGEFPTINVHVIYVTLAKTENDKVIALVPTLQAAVSKVHPNIVCTAQLWGAMKLYEEAQKQNLNIRKLRVEKSPVSHGKGYVFIARLRDYYEFITDDGDIIDSLFEFNVRDYHRNASVNKEMGATLANTSDPADFWWLNNGITILAEHAAHQDDSLTIKNPLVVNGLQTSHEIFNFFKNGGMDDRRALQVRVLQIDDNTLRDRVIKATNSQTGIKAASLHATEPFQRKIEDFLEQLSIFYDRRRDYWRNKGKPAESIIGIERLAQSVMAVMLERPDAARARPTTILQDEDTYKEMFEPETDLNIYKVCAQLYFVVDTYFKQERKMLQSVYRNNLRYHLMMTLTWRLNKSRPVHRAALGALKVSTLKKADIADEMAQLRKIFDKAGATDKTAKDAAFTDAVRKRSKIKANTLAKAAPAEGVTKKPRAKKRVVKKVIVRKK